jgi:hypothetical protein
MEIALAVWSPLMTALKVQAPSGPIEPRVITVVEAAKESGSENRIIASDGYRNEPARRGATSAFGASSAVPASKLDDAV